MPLKQTTDEAATGCPTVENVIVLQRIGAQANVTMQAGRDLWWHDLMANASPDCPPEPMSAEDPLFILYTSGSTGKPKGILHTTGGYLTGAYTTFKWIFDIKDTDLYCVYRRHWLDYRPFLRRLWPPCQRRHRLHVRRVAGLGQSRGCSGVPVFRCSGKYNCACV